MKGQEWIGGLFSLLLAGVVAGIALPMILPGQATKITVEVDNNEFENKALIIANVVMADERLIYCDNYTTSCHRGVFDKGKLDSMRGESLGIRYPDAYVAVEIADISMLTVADDSLKWLFEEGLSRNERSTQILDSVHPIGRGLPVAIRYSEDNVRMGFLKVTVME